MKTIPDPLNGEEFVQLPDTQPGELEPFVQSLQACPKSGLHNPLKNPERCVCRWGPPGPRPGLGARRMRRGAAVSSCVTHCQQSPPPTHTHTHPPTHG
jgi:hypothetical protein